MLVAGTKERVAAAIARGRAALDEALSELEKMPAFDPGSATFAAHALNNYLTVIGGTVEMIQLHLEGHPDAQVRDWLQGVQHATNLMARTVGALMNAAATAETPLRLEQFDLPLMAQRACNYYQRVADQKSIHLVVDSIPEVPPVWGDRVLVAAVLDNLLSNAIKYSPLGKEIRVQLRGEKGWAVCGVRDEGPGLSPDDQAKLFQKGVRLTPRPTGGELSIGYGLAVAKQLVEKVGGAIWCESVLGQGACFWFRVPAHQEPLPAAGGKPAVPPAGGGEADQTTPST
jgi:signal transduction histidine kinase